MSSALKDSTEVISLVDAAISEFFETSITHATQIDSSYRQLWETMYGLIRSGGKRLRPRMTLLAYEAFGGTETERIIPVATAQELLHFSLLIHDDIIDRDIVRYGTPNVTGRYIKRYSSFIQDEKDTIHYANAAALLGGDLMLAAAHEMIATSELAAEQKSIASRLLARSIFEVAGGELLDTESSFVPYTTGDAFKIARYKTAGYSFIGPLVTGASLAGGDKNQIAALRVYGNSLGIAYQLVDDVLGVFGDELSTGKSSSSDITEGKRTFMVEYALDHLSEADKARFMEGFGNLDAGQQAIQAVRDLLVTSGALAEVKRVIGKYSDEARAAITFLKLSKPHETAFNELITSVTERTS